MMVNIPGPAGARQKIASWGLDSPHTNLAHDSIIQFVENGHDYSPSDMNGRIALLRAIQLRWISEAIQTKDKGIGRVEFVIPLTSHEVANFARNRTRKPPLFRLMVRVADGIINFTV